MQTGFAFSRFADRLASIVELSPGDLELLANMPSSICHYDSCHHVLKKGDHPNHCCLLLQGYLCWQDVDNHYGQITSIHVPGDVPDLYTVHDPRIDFDLVTLRPAVVASVPHRFFREISALSPSISRALLFLLLTDAAALRNCIVNLGSRDAYHRCSRRRDAVLRMLSRAHRRRAAEADAECINIVSRSPPALQTTGARYPGTRQA